MHKRCKDTTDKDYGGRGIKVCERWENFENFYEDMGERPAGLTIDRVDTNGDYCKENCRWATRLVQSRNRRNVKQIQFEGKLRCLSEITEMKGVNYNTVKDRLRKGLSIEEALIK